ncbi:Preprotein translocase subunit SecG, partial [Marine Group I thaumarchaeote SCGC AAA799-B03]
PSFRIRMADKKSAPLPASSGGLMRFFEDETKGFKLDPRIVVSIPISLISISWVIDIFLAP